MKKTPLFALLLIGALFTAGCTNTVSKTETDTSAPQIIYVTVLVTPTETRIPFTETPTSIPIAAPSQPTTTNPTVVPVSTPQSAVLFHRWVNTTGDYQSDNWMGMETKFYPDGSVLLYNGTINEVGSNIVMKKVSEVLSGTWTSAGTDTYIAKMYVGGIVQTNPMIYEIRYYPNTTDVKYPGLIIPERVYFGDKLFVRAKTD